MDKEKISKYNREYYEKNKEKIRKWQYEYYVKNEEKMKEYRKKYYQEHKEELNKKSREYIKTHKEAYVKSIMESKKRRAERLRQEGVINPWSVINKGAPKQYDPKIGVIDLETNDLIAIFNSYKECADYFGTTTRRIRDNIRDKHRKRFMGKWYKLIVAERNAS